MSSMFVNAKKLNTAHSSEIDDSAMPPETNKTEGANQKQEDQPETHFAETDSTPLHEPSDLKARAKAKKEEDKEKEDALQNGGGGGSFSLVNEAKNLGKSLMPKFRNEAAAEARLKQEAQKILNDPSILAREADRDVMKRASSLALDDARQLHVAANNFRKTTNFAKLKAELATAGIPLSVAMSDPKFQEFIKDLSDPSTQEGREFAEATRQVTEKSAALESSWREQAKVAADLNFDVTAQNMDIASAANRPALNDVPFDRSTGDKFNTFAEKFDDLATKAREAAQKVAEMVGRIFGR